MHCITEKLTIGRLFVERNVINDNPDYQRESGLWSVDKQQLFLDSVFHSFDIPKLYFHDLRIQNGRYHFAVIDGKQRLYTIWNFIGGGISLAEDFEFYMPNPDNPTETLKVAGGTKFSDLPNAIKEYFKSCAIDVVLVQNADEEDIEELFSRLNNGEPLSAAEKRNAIGGEMTSLIRAVAQNKFFTEHISFSRKRRQEYEAVAKLLLIENTEMNGGEPYCDLKKKHLDSLVVNNRDMKNAAKNGLERRVTDQLSFMSRIFGREDPLLSKQAYVPLYYLFTKSIYRTYGARDLVTKIRNFLGRFQALRISNLDKDEETRDVVLVEFGRLMQQGTNDKGSLRDRVATLTRYFLLENSDVEIKDIKRYFTHEERTTIWILGGKQCAECGITLEDLDQMHADHIEQHSFAGPTILANARCLCENCNTRLAESLS